MSQAPSFKTTKRGKKFLGVRFAKCMAYGRLYSNDEGSAYVGMCPKCGKTYHVRIGAEGTSKRMFIAYC